ncbi:uncharacterized protein LOC111947104 [Oryzias latipes]|uniref:uncharacterized protein LOC111947104 n=1 Tax=Oryzias latipes TaxID=8090 RepID=UPI000CE221E0|nr:uncharacterized protein LOC111947104 [Oryzias latipes]
MTLVTRLRRLIFAGKSKRKALKLIKWMQKNHLLRREMKCSICHKRMKLKKWKTKDHYAWKCQRAVHRGKKRVKSIRHKSLFQRSKISLFEWMQFIYRFSQGLRLRQIDMIADNIAASSTTLTKMAKKLRQVCITAVKRMRRNKGQIIGGRHEFVVIDESHFRHKRKYGKGRMAGAWKRKMWVFGMLGVQGQRSGKPVLRLVKKRTRRELVPLIARHVKPGSTIMSDEWRAYRILPALGYKHFTVNHSQFYVNPQNGAHTQHIERAWRTYKEQVWRLRGNQTEDMLRDHLCLIEWNEWLAKNITVVHLDGYYTTLRKSTIDPLNVFFVM